MSCLWLFILKMELHPHMLHSQALVEELLDFSIDFSEPWLTKKSYLGVREEVSLSFL